MNITFPYAKQSIDEQDIKEVCKALKNPSITRGPLVEEFEENIAQYCQVKYAVAFHSGTSALQACSYALDIQEKDEIISTPNTFIATVLYPYQKSSSIRFTDIDLETGNMSLDKLEEALLKEQTRGKQVLIPVHFSGIPIDMRRLESFIQNPETRIIEDAAHAIGSRYEDGSMVGSCHYSDATIFSFHPAKTITSAEGGMVTTNDPKIYEKLLLYRNNGIIKTSEHFETVGPWYYEVHDCTGNYNFTDMQAALGLSQLKKLKLFVDKRRELIREYRKAFASFPTVTLSPEIYDEYSAYHLCVARIDFTKYTLSKEKLMKELLKEGIGTQVHYIPLYRHPVFSDPRLDPEVHFPQMEKYYSEALSLPLYPDLKAVDVKTITDTLKNILEKNSR